jgi:hypothetical protein
MNGKRPDITLDVLIADHFVLPGLEDESAFEWATAEVQDAFMAWATLTQERIGRHIYAAHARAKATPVPNTNIDQYLLVAA